MATTGIHRNTAQIGSIPLSMTRVEIYNLEPWVSHVKAWVKEVYHCLTKNTNFSSIIIVLLDNLLDLGPLLANKARS
jgi:hypothetical protein